VKTLLKMTLTAALPLVSLLWITPPAVAYDTHRSHEHRRSWSDSSSYRAPSYGRYSHEWERRRGPGSSWQYGENSRKYHKAMHRLSRQEREARAKAARRYEGDRRDPRYRERLAEIDRRYDHKRYQARRNMRND
jgi:hypothetical protein